MADYVAVIKKPEAPSGYGLVYLPHLSGVDAGMGPEGVAFLDKSKKIVEQGVEKIVQIDSRGTGAVLELCRGLVERGELPLDEISDFFYQHAQEIFTKA